MEKELMAVIKAQNLKLANEFALEGTVKHFALRLGFMPYDEAQAEAILESVINEKELLEAEKERLEKEIKYLQYIMKERQVSI